MNSKRLSMVKTQSAWCAQAPMKAKRTVLLASAVFLLLTSVATAQPAEKKPVYQDPTQSIRVRVDDLMKPLIENVEEGRVSMALVDRAVRRVLTQKYRLGLFERPYVDTERAVKLVHAKAHQDLALRTARDGIVLLKNEGNLLPLKKNLKSIAVIGPHADSGELGDYSPRVVLQHVVTVLEGIKAKVSPTTKILQVWRWQTDQPSADR
jgi:beta-glucosidase-like glycosyl hydrolase